MKQLWTPWRMAFIEGDKAPGCIFCDKIREDADRQNYILYRGELAFIILNLYPYNNGHLMVVPYQARGRPHPAGGRLRRRRDAPG